MSTRVVALVTCHNRRDVTLRCLRSYFSQTFDRAAPLLEAVVVDDGSTDGTGEAVRSTFPAVHLVLADGTLYWARAMQLAEAHAVRTRPDYLLWLNDDVTLERTALDVLLSTSDARTDAVVVGAVRDPDTGSIAYSGVVRSRWHPLRVRRVAPGKEPRDVDTFNGNVVLVPRAVYERLGPIDGGFAHSQADLDYGLRAQRAGFGVVVAPAAVGACSRGGKGGTFRDSTLSLRRRWELVQRPTGLPMRSHARYLRRHGGPLWPLFWLAPYAKLIMSTLVTAPRRRLRPRDSVKCPQ